MLAHKFPGTGYLDVIVTGVADEDRVIELLIRNGQLQVAAAGTEHVPTIPGQGVKEHKDSCHPGAKVVWYGEDLV